MSCDFCSKFNFTKVSVRDGALRIAGGNTNFVDSSIKDPSVKLFHYCPICGSALLYDAPVLNEGPKLDIKPMVVAVDSNWNKVDYAVFDGETTVTVEAYDLIKQLREETGCGIRLCKDAYKYALEHNGGYIMMVAYCKAKVAAVKSSMPFDERVKKYMEDDYYDKL